MWKLKCVNNNETVAETVVKYTNIIGRDNIRLFFARNGNPMMTSELESVLNMENGETLRFYFPNKVKFIEVIAF